VTSGVPKVSVPVLSKTTVSAELKSSRYNPPLMIAPSRADRPIPPENSQRSSGRDSASASNNDDGYGRGQIASDDECQDSTNEIPCKSVCRLRRLSAHVPQFKRRGVDATERKPREHEARTGGQRDENWPDWYAAYMVPEHDGKELPQ